MRSDHSSDAVGRHVVTGSYVSDSHQDREVFGGNCKVKDRTAGAWTRILEASTEPDRGHTEWQVKGGSHYALSKVNLGFGAAGTYLADVLWANDVVIDDVAGGRGLRVDEYAEELGCAGCCADADYHWVDERQALAGCCCRHLAGLPNETVGNEHMRRIAS